jgi:hypothetical protein
MKKILITVMLVLMFVTSGCANGNYSYEDFLNDKAKLEESLTIVDLYINVLIDLYRENQSHEMLPKDFIQSSINTRNEIAMEAINNIPGYYFGNEFKLTKEFIGNYTKRLDELKTSLKKKAIEIQVDLYDNEKQFYSNLGGVYN